MTVRPTDRVSLLLPQPLRCDPTGKCRSPMSEVCRISGACDLDLHVGDTRVERAARSWQARFPAGSRRGSLRVTVDRSIVSDPQGYRLDVTPDRIGLTGGDAAGCFWGLQTLVQISDFRAGVVECCQIEDHPDFATRGLLYDVTRGRVPTLETLKTLVDRLSALKINQLQLNIEHAFAFTFDPEICPTEEGLTPDEARELDAYARERFIDLVPALATFGHMGRILSMPRYRHLAEIETTKPWLAMSWAERMRGLTLDCMNPESRQLVERMWSDVLAAFSSPVVNICGDEPWDLGRGKNKGRFSREQLGKAYVNRLRETCEFAARYGRRTQFWSDVVNSYPDLLAGLRNSTVLHWGYDDRTDYEGTAKFVQAGLDTFVCPGTSGWKRIINAMDLAQRNVSTFARAGRECGATGLLNTDWGDHGHFNLPACSWHGIALGAAMGWSVDHPTGRSFDERFTRAVLGIDDASGIELLRKASAVGGGCETWRLLWMPLSEIAADGSLPSAIEIEEAKGAAEQAAGWCGRHASSSAAARVDLDELRVACKFLSIWADKIGFLRGTGMDRRDEWVKGLEAASEQYAACWRARNKPSGLDDILRALSRASDDVKSFSG